MIPEGFEYVRADSVDDAVALLESHGLEAKVLAGGHSLIPLMKLRLAAPGVLVDIARLQELRYVRDDGDTVSIGSLVRHADLLRDPLIAAKAPLVAAVAAVVGDRQVRHRGTIGGSVVHADPAADFPCALLAAGATFVVAGPAGERQVPASEMFTGYFSTTLDPSEILVEIRVPALDRGQGWAYEKFTQRAQDWAIVAAAVVVDYDGDEVRSARIGLANMGSTPVRAKEAEGALVGARRPDYGAGSALADSGTNPPADLQANEEFRRHLSRVVTRRALEAAATARQR